MLRILYVDDDSEYRLLVSEEIKNRLGVEIETAESGNEVIARLKSGQRYSVIISDYSMPDGNGAALYKYLAEKEIFSLFILFTGGEIDSSLKAQFLGKTFLGAVPKCNLRQLCTLLAIGVTSWRA